MRILLMLALWAREELNLRPHAYQAARQKMRRLYLRAIQSLRSGRLGLGRTKGGGNRAQKRRQGVDSERSAEPPAARILTTGLTIREQLLRDGWSVSCPWCNGLNPKSDRFCGDCLHRTDLPRDECDCLRCVPIDGVFSLDLDLTWRPRRRRRVPHELYDRDRRRVD